MYSWIINDDILKPISHVLVLWFWFCALKFDFGISLHVWFWHETLEIGTGYRFFYIGQFKL